MSKNKIILALAILVAFAAYQYISIRSRLKANPCLALAWDSSEITYVTQAISLCAKPGKRIDYEGRLDVSGMKASIEYGPASQKETISVLIDPTFLKYIVLNAARADKSGETALNIKFSGYLISQPFRAIEVADVHLVALLSARDTLPR